jgi:DNA-binding protein H-NS
MLKNLAEKRKFEEFLENMKRDKDLQEKLKKEKIDPGDKSGRAKIKAFYRERNSGVTWTGASVHGAVPKRNKRRDFLPKNR